MISARQKPGEKYCNFASKGKKNSVKKRNRLARRSSSRQVVVCLSCSPRSDIFCLIFLVRCSWFDSWVIFWVRWWYGISVKLLSSSIYYLYGLRDCCFHVWRVFCLYFMLHATGQVRGSRSDGAQESDSRQSCPAVKIPNAYINRFFNNVLRIHTAKSICDCVEFWKSRGCQDSASHEAGGSTTKIPFWQARSTRRSVSGVPRIPIRNSVDGRIRCNLSF